jgi:hypothetical protein
LAISILFLTGNLRRILEEHTCLSFSVENDGGISTVSIKNPPRKDEGETRGDKLPEVSMGSRGIEENEKRRKHHKADPEPIFKVLILSIFNSPV